LTIALLDDHLLRDLLAQNLSTDLARLLRRHEPATTNLYLYRLCRSVVSARGGALTGSWLIEQRRALGRSLVALADSIQVVPMRQLTYRMAEIAGAYPVSTLGAEVAAAAACLGAGVFVWEGDDGPGIEEAVTSVGAEYATVAR
jgi:hypothetical protein